MIYLFVLSGGSATESGRFGSCREVWLRKRGLMAARDGIVGGLGEVNSVLPAGMLSARACWLFVAVVVRFLLC